MDSKQVTTAINRTYMAAAQRAFDAMPPGLARDVALGMAHDRAILEDAGRKAASWETVSVQVVYDDATGTSFQVYGLTAQAATERGRTMPLATAMEAAVDLARAQAQRLVDDDFYHRGHAVRFVILAGAGWSDEWRAADAPVTGSGRGDTLRRWLAVRS